jgi:hypothetical protein
MKKKKMEKKRREAPFHQFSKPSSSPHQLDNRYHLVETAHNRIRNQHIKKNSRLLRVAQKVPHLSCPDAEPSLEQLWTACCRTRVQSVATQQQGK